MCVCTYTIHFMYAYWTCMYTYVWTYTYIHTFMYKYIHIYTYVYIYVYMYTYIYTYYMYARISLYHMRACIEVYTYIRTHALVPVYKYVRVHIYTYTYKYVYMYIHTNIDVFVNIHMCLRLYTCAYNIVLHVWSCIHTHDLCAFRCTYKRKFLCAHHWMSCGYNWKIAGLAKFTLTKFSKYSCISIFTRECMYIYFFVRVPL